ncbi:MAG TPA: hypothetical protein VKS60_16345 [Stellaceae bacterium]|nr:hypothetical protein [Stellaceae bacterium]
MPSSSLTPAGERDEGGGCCYCSIGRETQGGSGYAVNLGGDAGSLEVEGREHITIYHARMVEDGREEISTAERHFCS